MSTSSPKQKIAILGGGTAAMSTAFELTGQPGWDEKYEITVFQLGWRLGGKGASGRNVENSQRIEEHGLHVWGGFYENAFALMRRCYDELRRDAGQPLATWDQAFRPKQDVLWEEYIHSRWAHWELTIPARGGLPGDGARRLTLWECLTEALRFLESHVEAFPQAHRHLPSAASLETWAVEHLRQFAFWKGDSANSPPAIEAKFADALASHRCLAVARQVAASLPSDPSQHGATDHHVLASLLDTFRKCLRTEVESLASLSDEMRRLWIIADLTITGIRGCLVDGVLWHGFDVINDLNWVDWLRLHGASDLTLQSAPVRGWHDYFFAYREGDPNQPCIEAGTSMRQLVLLLLQSKGAIFWKMQAGMGDVVFGPLYQVLQRRGVQFEFFHRVEALHLSDDKQFVDAIDVGVQATLTAPGEYQPLVEVKGLPCWPSEPLYDQLEEGAELRARSVNLESPWTDWRDVAHRTLRRGTDFDLVVIGTSLAPLQDIAAELISASSSWQAMMNSIETTPTIAVQVWFDPPATRLGSIPEALMTGYTDPLQTWGDFSHLIAREDWPVDKTPGNLAYFCGPLTEPERTPPYSDHGFQNREDERARQVALHSLQQGGAHLFPNISPPYTGITGLDWEQMTDPQDRASWRRFNAQYWRANVSPSERYVLAVPGSSRTRLRNGQSGFQNAFVAGDWVYTGLAGSIEGAVMSGMFASRAITGSPAVVHGEVFGGS